MEDCDLERERKRGERRGRLLGERKLEKKGEKGGGGVGQREKSRRRLFVFFLTRTNTSQHFNFDLHHL